MLRDRGVSVPGQVSVMGFDNWEVLTSGARPPLTSVDMNFEMIGPARRNGSSTRSTESQQRAWRRCRAGWSRAALLLWGLSASNDTEPGAGASGHHSLIALCGSTSAEGTTQRGLGVG